MIDLAIKRPVATGAIYLGLFALGAYSARLIPVELLPDVDYPRLTVNASWNGASPESMEAFVTSPLEAASQRIQGVRKVTSTSRVDRNGTGSSAEIEIEFTRDTRMEFAELDLSERFAALKDELPPGVRPSIEAYVPQEFSQDEQFFMSFRITGPYTFSRLAEIAEEEIKPSVLGVDGVAAANIYGGQAREVSIELDRARLESYDLRPEDVRQRIEDLSVLRAPGSLLLDGRQVVLSVRTRVAHVRELESLVIAERSGGPVRLSDLGTVREQTADTNQYFRINGQPAISMYIDRKGGTNAIDVAAAVREQVTTIGARLPPGVQTELDLDQSDEIRRQLTGLRLRAIAASIVIFLVLMLFLRSLSSVLVVFATIGFSVLAAINLLYLGGFSLNVLTLAGLAWGFGLIVDNSIVVLENVERHRALGKSRARAALEGTRQVALPVLAATATTAIVLVPFLFLRGELRLYYVPLAFAVGFSILASLFVAFTFVPTMAARLAERSASSAEVAPARRTPIYLRSYRALLSSALDHPMVVTTLCLAALGGSFWLFKEHVNTGTLWRGLFAQRTYIDVIVRFPRGAGLDRTDELTRFFEEKIATLPEVKRYETRVRPAGARIQITFPKDLEQTQIPVAIKEQMVAYSHQFSGPEVRVYGFGPSFYGGGGSPPNYSLKILGYNYLDTKDIADDIGARLERFSRIRDVDTNASGSFFDRDKESEFFLTVDRDALGQHELSVEELLRFVNANLQTGISGQRLRIGGEELPYTVKLAGFRDFGQLDMEQLRVPAQNGTEVRLADVAQVEERTVMTSIRREDQQYERTVAWEFRGPRKLGDLVRDVVIDATELPPGYKIEEDVRWRWSVEEETQVYLAIAFAVLLIYMVTAALFESLMAPFVVLLTIPLALIGVFLIFFYTDASFTRTAYIGTIMMGGIVVNNAILIVYHIGELRESLPTREAIIQGTLERVRPILMTTLTTVFGLLPLVLFAESQDANIWNSLALATIGGLISSTMFVLVAIPVAYRYLVVRRSAAVT